MNVCPVLIGREPELAALTAALERGGLVLVAGEAGIGKSRLLRELESIASERGHRVVWGRPEVVSTPGPYSVIVDLVDDIASVSEAAKEAADLSTALGAPTESGGEPPARQIAVRVRALLATLGARPVILIEDLHVADELSQAVIAHLARGAADDGVLVVGTYRPEESWSGSLARLLSVLHRDRLVTQIDLEALQADALGDMLRAMWGSEPTDEHIAEIARLGEGVPLFIEELANAKTEGVSSIPSSISWAVDARLGRLDDAAREVLRVASLMIGAIDPAILAAVCEQPAEAIPRSLVGGVAAGLLADREGRLVFRHALVREAMAGSIVSVERAALHGRIADAIRTIHPDQVEHHAATLARHYTEAGRAPEAAKWWLVSARRALDAGALDEARTALREAAARAGGDVAVDVTSCDADLQVRLGDLEAGIRLYGSVVEDRRRSGAPTAMAPVVIKLARLLYFSSTSNRPQAIALLDEALAADRLASDMRARLLITKGTILTRDHRADEGEPILTDALQLAESLGDLELRAEAHAALSWLSEFRMRPDEALSYGERACELAIRSDKHELIGRTHVDHALQLALRGRGEDALHRLDTAREHLASLFAAGFAVDVCDHNKAWVLWRMGRPADAEAVATRLETTRFARQYGRVVRAWAACERGSVGLADAIVQGWWDELGGQEFRARSRRDPGAIREPSDEPVLAVLADLTVQILSGRVTPQLVEEARAYAQLCRAGSGDIVCLASMLYARALCAEGRFQDAAAELDEVATVADDYPYHRATMLELRAAISDADDAFLDAAQAYAEAGNASDQARCLRLHGARSLRGGNRDAAVDALKQACALARDVGATAELNRGEAALRDLGVRPRAGRPKGSGTKKGAISDREQEVVALLATGATNAEISARLFLSERTVRDHIASAQRRLGVTGRPGLVAWAFKQGLA